MAMEDAFICAELLMRVDDKVDISEAFKVYDAIRRPRSQRLVTTSREAGQLYHFELTENDQQLKENLENRMKWIWDADHQAELDQAVAMLEERFKNKRAVSPTTSDVDGAGRVEINGAPIGCWRCGAERPLDRLSTASLTPLPMTIPAIEPTVLPEIKV